jgi:phospholipid/cholesterol/gamma-HCH transport system ATP-binding protein
LIELKHISKSFGDNHVLKDISVEFERNKVNLIIGQSGSGKSVLTKCMVGLHQPDAGKVIFDGRSISDLNHNERTDLRKEIGMLFQASALFDSMTVEENVMFPLKMFTKMSKEEMLDRVNFCLNRVNLVNANKLFPSEASGGMQKRIGIARAIAMNPRYLFCDEPNSGLDPKTSIVIDNLIDEITHEFDITSVVITHDMHSVMEIGENIIFLYEGQLWWKGDKDDIMQTDNKELNDFVYASKFMKSIKEIHNKGR